MMLNLGNYTRVLFCAVLYGGAMGMVNSLFQFTVIKVMGKKMYVEALGGVGIIISFLCLCLPPVLGEGRPIKFLV